MVYSISNTIGICDCCDGADENESPFEVNCPNTCTEQLQALRKQTLEEYMKISSGLQAKNELINLMKRKKLREEQSFNSLVLELEETEKLYYQMRVFSSQESWKESQMQFSYIRKRVRECADQALPHCDVFGEGLSSTVLDDTALPVSIFGEEEEYLDLDSPTQPSISENNSGKEEEAKKKARERETVRKETMTALQRIQSSYCSYIEQDVRGLLFEENPRIHKSVQQYLTYSVGKGGIADRKRERQVDVIRRTNTLFGPYLDNGDEGKILGLQVMCEIFGLFLSPLIVPLSYLSNYCLQLQTAFWLRMKNCLQSETDCSNWTISLAKSLREGGSLSRVLDALDYTQYNFLVRLSQEWSPLTTRLRWYSTLVQQTPFYYYHYYISPILSRKKDETLPVKRDACTLREGIRVAEEEITALKDKINDRKREEEMKNRILAEKESCDDEEVCQSGPGSVIDYSPDGSWEALSDTCLEKQIGQYSYKFCFFRSAYQGNTHLGSFQNWGDPSQTQNDGKKSRFSRVKEQMKGSLINGWTAPVNNLLQRAASGLGLSGEAEGERRTDYTKQFYGGGDRCHNGKIRNTIVKFHCNISSSIEDVLEYEVGWSIFSFFQLPL